MFSFTELIQKLSHRVGRAIESMVSDCLIEADPYLKIFDAIHDPEQYMYLTDAVLNRIENCHDPGIETAKAILRRIRRRDLYKIVDEVLVPLNRIDQIKGITEKDICNFGKHLNPEDITLQQVSMNYGKNPRLVCDLIFCYCAFLGLFLPYNSYERE